ncbi:MAG: FtsX-like permease family protein [Cyclobacteriaceae bacterium]
MLRNYLLVALRNLNRNRTYTLINVFGLSIAMAIAVVGYLNLMFDLKYNHNHENMDNIFKVNGKRNLNGDIRGVGIVPMPLGDVVKQDISGILNVVRIEMQDQVLKLDDDIFRERISYVDPTFFDVFTFPLRYGSPKSIEDPRNIIISENLAVKLFGQVDPTGEEITLVTANQQQISYRIGGVLEKAPKNSSIRITALMEFSNFFDHNPDERPSDWGNWVDGAFLHLESAENAPLVEQQLQQYVPIQNEANERLALESFYLDPLSEMAFNENDLMYGRFWTNMPKSAVYSLTGSAVLILLLACFNFTNTSIAFVSRRLKEIGIRKVFGGNKRQLITQFMLENIVLITISLAISFIFVELLIPQFNSLFPFVEIDLNVVGVGTLVAFMFCLLGFVGLLAALYPSLYISSFRPVSIFRGKVKLGGTNLFTRVLIGGQIVITVYNIFASIAFYQNSNYQRTLDQGYDLRKAVVVPINGKGDFEALRGRIQDSPLVERVAGSQTQLVFHDATAVIEHENIQQEVGWLRVGFDYIETMGLRIKEGRSFEKGIENESSNVAIVNEKLVSDFGLSYGNGESAVGKRLWLDSAYFTIAGVVEDFNERVMLEGNDIRPALITLVKPDAFNYLTVKTSGDAVATNELVKSAWFDVIPNKPYDGFYQSRVIDQIDFTNSIINRVNIFVTLVAILLSSIGLYTMVSLNIIKRLKEIGIRKVLGASIADIVRVINRTFAGIIIIGSVVGAISGYVFIDWLLDIIYSYRLPLSFWPVFLAFGVMLVVVATTVGSKIYGAARLNPVDHLRNE